MHHNTISIYCQRRHSLRAVDLYNLTITTSHLALSAHDVQCIITLVPQRAVEVVAILCLLVVKADKAAIAEASRVAHSSKVKHRIEPHAPEQRIVNMAHISLMEAGLPTLRDAVLATIAVYQLLAVVSLSTACAITNALTQVSPAATQGSLPHIKARHIALIPAHALLPYDNVCDKVYIPILIATSHCWELGGKALCQSIKALDICHQLW